VEPGERTPSHKPYKHRFFDGCDIRKAHLDGVGDGGSDCDGQGRTTVHLDDNKRKPSPMTTQPTTTDRQTLSAPRPAAPCPTKS